MAPKNTDTVAEKPAFDVSQTDKRSDKRVLLDYVFAQRFAPELLPIFEQYEAELDAAIDEATLEIHTPVDTLIAQQTEAVTKRYEGDYSDYVLRGNAASFFTEKKGRVVKSAADKASDFLEKADPEQLAALAALLADRGISLDA